MNLKEEITQLVEKLAGEAKSELFRKPIVGISHSDNPLYKDLKDIVGPEHVHPRDLLPEAKSIISFFIPVSELVVKTNRIGEIPSKEYAKSYLDENILIDQISDDLVKLLNDKGFKAATIKATHTYDPETLKSAWSHRSAAYIGNMGQFGVNRMLITKEGCAGRFGTVITSAEIPLDQEESHEYCLYYKNGSCKKCIDACPVGALEIDSLDKFKCNDRLLENMEKLKDVGECDVCGKCLTICPVAIIK
ncbi:epoxyqueuosine reductase [Tissierella creatinini]|nr:epoxyqueuosine reductase [Tissierella creatinini]TJX59413.1 epoxyqueuosine reductase [Soehngenia saccharolytica]